MPRTEGSKRYDVHRLADATSLFNRAKNARDEIRQSWDGKKYRNILRFPIIKAYVCGEGGIPDPSLVAYLGLSSSEYEGMEKSWDERLTEFLPSNHHHVDIFELTIT